LKICLLTIARNEIENIKHLICEIEKVCSINSLDLFFVDGNSKDGTQEFLESKNIICIQQSLPGRGGAILSAFKSLDKYDAYILFSPDGNENIQDIPLFIQYLKEGNDLVIASRMLENARNEEDDQIIKPRKWANNAFNLLVNILFNRGDFVSDSINGYRAITKIALNAIKIDACDYTIEYQMTIRCMKKHLKIKEFPTIEGNRIFGTTGAPSIPTGLAFIKRLISEIINYRLHS
jgi:hypothetical protein